MPPSDGGSSGHLTKGTGGSDEAQLAMLFSNANQIMQKVAEQQDVSLTHIPDLVSRCENWCQSARPQGTAHNATKTDDTKIVFFCGFPRSGTTLMEKILSRHPKIITSDEASALSEAASLIGEFLGKDHVFPAGINQLKQEQIENLREIYFHKLGCEKHDKDTLIVDKLPLNILFLEYGFSSIVFQNKNLFYHYKPSQKCFLAQTQRWIQFSNPRNTKVCLRFENRVRLDFKPKPNF